MPPRGRHEQGAIGLTNRLHGAVEIGSVDPDATALQLRYRGGGRKMERIRETGRDDSGFGMYRGKESLT